MSFRNGSAASVVSHEWLALFLQHESPFVYVMGDLFVIPDLIRDPEAIENTGLRLLLLPE
jgi:hypothetical protein